MRDHGGNIDWAMQNWGGDPSDWIDLSTGINREPWPVPALTKDAWTALPTKAAMSHLKDVAAATYHTKAEILPLAGAQAAIQMLPRLRSGRVARILSPTYNEHKACAQAAGWQVEDVSDLEALKGADLAIVVNPNNPDGQQHDPDQLLALTDHVGELVVDESFADPRPDLSIAPMAGEKENLFVLRSFGKFYGLAGVRLGFLLGHPDAVSGIRELAGPWPISGAAIEIGSAALQDQNWATQTTSRLRQDCVHMDEMALKKGWELVGGCELFRLYDTPSAAQAQKHLASSHIWSRIFPWSETLIRLGLPAVSEWERVAAAMENLALEHTDGI